MACLSAAAGTKQHQHLHERKGMAAVAPTFCDGCLAGLAGRQLLPLLLRSPGRLRLALQQLRIPSHEPVWGCPRVELVPSVGGRLLLLCCAGAGLGLGSGATDIQEQFWAQRRVLLRVA